MSDPQVPHSWIVELRQRLASPTPRRLPPSEGAAAMQAINLEAPTRGFVTIFFGTAVVSLALAVAAFADVDALVKFLSG